MATLQLTDASRLYGTLSGSTDLTSPADTINIVKTNVYTNGTGVDQADEFWSDTRTVTAAPESLNLRDNTLVNGLGTTISLTSVKGIIIRNKSTTSRDVLVLTGDFITKTGTDNLGAITSVNVHPGGEWKNTSPIDGLTVDATSDVITISPGANTITYDIIVWGVD